MVVWYSSGYRRGLRGGGILAHFTDGICISVEVLAGNRLTFMRTRALVTFLCTKLCTLLHVHCGANISTVAASNCFCRAGLRKAETELAAALEALDESIRDRLEEILRPDELDPFEVRALGKFDVVDAMDILARSEI